MPKTLSAIGAKAAPATLEPRPRPSQKRGKETFEMILTTAGELLAEVGFERLSTNLVCERAGLAPTALYRYFPNKYSILHELARRLMDAQDEAVFAWLDQGGATSAGLEEAVRKSIELQRTVNAITRAQPGGIWILRALRAAPSLQAVQIASRDRVAARLFDAIKAAYPDLPDEALRVAMRMTTQVMYAATEMVMEEPDADEERITEEACLMVNLYYQRLLGQRAPAPPISARSPEA